MNGTEVFAYIVGIVVLALVIWWVYTQFKGTSNQATGTLPSELQSEARNCKIACETGDTAGFCITPRKIKKTLVTAAGGDVAAKITIVDPSDKDSFVFKCSDVKDIVGLGIKEACASVSCT